MYVCEIHLDCLVYKSVLFFCTVVVCILGTVYMTPGRLSRPSEFTPVPSHGSTFVHMVPPRQQESPRREFTPVVVPRRQFHSGTKSRNGIM